MSETITRIPRTVWELPETAGSTGLRDTGPLHSHPEHLRFPFVGFIVLTELISPTSAFPPFSSCLLPAVLFPPLVNIKRSQGEAEVPMGHGVCTWPLHIPLLPKSVTARAAAGPPRATGQSMQEEPIRRGQELPGTLSTNRAAGNDCLGPSCFNQAVGYIFLLNGMNLHFKRFDQALNLCADETII